MQMNLFGEGGSGKDGNGLEHARKYVRDQLEEGVECPVCKQMCRLYRRKLNSGLAAGLVWLVAEWRRHRGWVDMPIRAPRFILRAGGQFSILAHWGLIEQQINIETRKRCAGKWRPTTDGALFADGVSLVPRYVLLYNNQVEGWSDEQIGVREALGDKFDYEELWNENLTDSERASLRGDLP